MRVNPVTSFSKPYALKRLSSKSMHQTQTISETDNQPKTDTVSFRGGITHGINSARKWVDYGDIFHEGVNLAGRSLVKAKSKLVNLQNANLSGTNFSKSVFHSGNFTGANLTNTNFENAILDGSWFKDVMTKNTNFKNSNLSDAIFKGEFGTWTSLEKANVTGADFKDANLENINLSGALYDGYTEFPRGFDPDAEGMILYKEYGFDMSNSSELQRMKLRYLNFNGADFHGANLKRADLKGVNFNNCDMRNCNLTKAYAKEAKIVNSDLLDSDLRRVNLDKAYLWNVDLRGADLSEARLTWDKAENVNLENAIYNRDTVFKPGFNPKEHGMIESSYVYDYLD